MWSWSRNAGFSFRSDSRFLGMVCVDGGRSAGGPYPPSGRDVVLTYSQSGRVFALTTGGRADVPTDES